MMNDIGLYVHIPFCLSKCPYCDFCSERFSREKSARYAAAVIRNIRRFGRSFDTVYFGGGTPILLYGHIGEMIGAADISEGAEITAEANPCMAEPRILETLRLAGVNRLSFGVQSMNPRELSFLGRRHTVRQAENALKNARKTGFKSISADMMIGLPGQTAADISHTAKRLAELGADHISAYILKVEDGTPFALRGITPPDDDTAAELYLHTVSKLEALGYRQYEISNFAKPGHECRHNLKYWRCEEYLGIGASAHSFLEGRRFCVPPDIDGFISSAVQADVTTDDNAGGWEEYAMLKLRLTEGLTFAEAERYAKATELQKNAAAVPEELLTKTVSGIALTPRGFLVSNHIIGKLVFG